jgi:hypothetical protein
MIDRTGSTHATDPLPPEVAGQIAEWRSLMSARPGVAPEDVDELEDHLVSQMRDLRSAGLSPEEALLIALRRLGAQDAVAREFGAVHSERLWRQLGTAGNTPPIGEADATGRRDRAQAEPATRPARWDLLPALGLGLLAGLAVRLPYSVLGEPAFDGFYLRNIAFLVLPFLAAHFLIRRRLQQVADEPAGPALLAAVFAVSAVLVNLYPGDATGQTLWLSALHLPIALCVATGIAYLGPRWRTLEAWMDWVRFLGEAIVYYVLIALVGAALVGIVSGIFTAIDTPADLVAQVIGWVVPVCAAAAVLVCAWLVERKKSVIENMAPVLTSVFTPLLTVALAVFLVAAALTGNPVDLDRDVLIWFDAVLVAVTAIVLFTVSARTPSTPGTRPRTRALDWMQLALIVAAIAVDLLMLWAMAGRLLEWGASPNKLAGLGCNILLLAHLAGSAWFYGLICAGGGPGSPRAELSLQRWQSLALPAFGVWAGAVALAFPPVFGWI